MPSPSKSFSASEIQREQPPPVDSSIISIQRKTIFHMFVLLFTFFYLFLEYVYEVYAFIPFSVCICLQQWVILHLLVFTENPNLYRIDNFFWTGAMISMSTFCFFSGGINSPFNPLFLSVPAFWFQYDFLSFVI